MAGIKPILGTFDLSRVTMVIGIIPITEGLVTASISKEGDEITPVDSNLGDITLNIRRITRGTLSITLNALAEANILLQEYAASVRTFGAPAYFPIAIMDRSSKSGVMTLGWIQHQPDASYGETIEDREWVFGLADASTSIVAAGANVAAGVGSII